MNRESKKQSTDEHLFRQEMEDVVPLSTPPRSDSKPPRGPSRTRARQNTNPPEQSAVAPAADGAERTSSDDASSHRKNGVQTRMLQKLKRGHFPPGDQLDLHHMKVTTSHVVLQDFIADAQSRHLQCIRIIHGKGLRSKAGPVLKDMVHQALREHPAVLAFTTCKPAFGGRGKVAVLLKLS